MKRAAVAVAALAAGGLLGACSVNADVTPASNATSVGAKPVSATGGDSRCASTDLSLSVGAPRKHDDGSGQLDVPLTFKNISARTCALYGVPDVSLIGPDDPNGTTYQLTGTDNGVRHNDVEPGKTATATVTVLQPGGDSVGSMGSTRWTPTKVQATPPGQQQPLTAAWPSTIAVLRQDSATHPGTFVNGILADPA